MCHHNTAQRAYQITGSKDPESLHLHQPRRDVRREKQFADSDGKKDENNKIVEFECAAQSRERECFIVLPVECPGNGLCHGFTFPVFTLLLSLLYISG